MNHAHQRAATTYANQRELTSSRCAGTPLLGRVFARSSPDVVIGGEDLTPLISAVVLAESHINILVTCMHHLPLHLLRASYR